MSRYFKSFFDAYSGPICEFVGLGVVTYWFLENVATLRTAYGPSMEPTIYSGNILLTERLSVHFNKIKKGDVIIAKYPYDPKSLVCKRIIGVPGDKIQTGLRTVIIPPGHVWLEGDNKKISQDSRTYGPVPQGLIQSKVMLRAFPFSIVENLLLL